MPVLLRIIAAIVLVGGIFGGIAAIAYTLRGGWRMLSRLVGGIEKLNRFLPVLMNIAAQFESNGGTTIRDKLDQAATNAVIAADNAAEAKMVAAEAKTVAAEAKTVATKILEVNREQTAILNEIKGGGVKKKK